MAKDGRVTAGWLSCSTSRVQCHLQFGRTKWRPAICRARANVCHAQSLVSRNLLSRANHHRRCKLLQLIRALRCKYHMYDALHSIPWQNHPPVQKSWSLVCVPATRACWGALHCSPGYVY